MIRPHTRPDKPHPAQSGRAPPPACCHGLRLRSVPVMLLFSAFQFSRSQGIILPMKVVLIKDVAGLGKTGDVKEVADGYARNFLLRRNLALPAVRSSMNSIETQLRREVKKQQQHADELARLAQSIEGLSIELKAKVMEEDRLYGSIRDHHIADELKRTTGIDIERTSIEMEQPIRQLGSYELTVRLTRDLAPKIKVTVARED
ncbi:MAG: 50S ribosomal protein L9 [Chloroflexi bacterium]|nr:50S ribosomal protein L9 [Chloroflexota bacterium]